MKRRDFVLAAGTAVPILAQTGKPDFSGRWILDEAKSEMGNRMRAGAYYEELVIEHRDPKLRMDYTVRFNGDTMRTLYDLTTDGAANHTQTPVGEEVSVNRWAGEKLVSEATIGKLDRTRITRFLSEDRKFLCVQYKKQSRNPGTLYFTRKA